MPADRDATLVKRLLTTASKADYQSHADHARVMRDAVEHIKAMEAGLRNLVEFIGDKDMRIYATDKVVREARALLGDTHDR